MIHNDFRKGTPLFIILKDGTKLIRKFVESKGRYLVTTDGEIPKRILRSVTIRRLNDTDNNHSR